MDEDDKGLEIDDHFAEEESSISSPASNVSGVVSFFKTFSHIHHFFQSKIIRIQDAHSSTSSGIATDESSSPPREVTTILSIFYYDNNFDRGSLESAPHDEKRL